jgi:cytochrome c
MTKPVSCTSNAESLLAFFCFTSLAGNEETKESSMNMRAITPLAAASIVTALYFASVHIFAADPVTKDEAVAMVKKAVAAIKTEGPEKAYAEIDDPSGQFVDRDFYIVVYGLDGMVLAHGANKERIGTNQIGDKDPDGRAFVKERVELAKTQPSFWQFMNPVTKTVEPKQIYCERRDETAVCGGIY